MTVEPCPNCGNTTPGKYCSECGQWRGERRVSLGRMLKEAIEDQLSLNAALPRTLRALVLKPGFLSAEYIDGRIQRYIPPFRLYLVTSVVFFLLLSFLARGGSGVVDYGDGVDVNDTTATVLELFQRGDTTAEGVPRNRRFAPIHTGWSELDSLANSRAREVADQPPGELGRYITGTILQRVPTAVFLMLPLYALLLFVLFFRRRRFYVEHFVFALHTHAFAFVLFTLTLLGQKLPWAGGLLTLWMFVYGFLALKRFYGQNWFLTLVKYGVLGFLYSIVFTAGITLTIIVALLLG